MKKPIILFILIVLSSSSIAAQEIGEFTDEEAISINIEAKWRPFNTAWNEKDYRKRIIQRKYDYTPPPGWVITSYQVLDEFKRSGEMEIYYAEGGKVNLSEEDLDVVYQYLIKQAEDLNVNEVLLNQINEDFEHHKKLLQNLKTDMNRLEVFTIVESHDHGVGHTSTRISQASQTRQSGLLRADIFVTMVYLGSDEKNQLLEELADKYGLKVYAGL